MNIRRLDHHVGRYDDTIENVLIRTAVVVPNYLGIPVPTVVKAALDRFGILRMVEVLNEKCDFHRLSGLD